MPLLELNKMVVGLSRVWSGFVRDWERSLRAGNYPQTTRYNYLLAACQLARYLAEHSPDPDADDAAEDPAAVSKAHIEAFQAWMIDTRSASTALNKHKALQQFFKWLLLEEEEIDRSPMERVKQPKTPGKLVPVSPRRTPPRCWPPARARRSPSCGTKRSSGCCATPAPACPKSAGSWWRTST
ncbi:phage integrase N-terminal SAM-like domain-containing protein [Streptomyces sp. NBC_01803]|uniref:phage integrase N-terminal SAM-like domain-containing protein n=1 Tax=Streptomyces sp. NBC_01803 TaxID=2975946 RepID=UPI002DDB8E9F|nr:phage integrase N-terminal SAM-like domain-containing protein [Streptomyces sp. NBC_01803]WSA42936.1 phage integrase N-terminal SAM-like domain-containing protein [Streptomyces sp. NBC_01803]